MQNDETLREALIDLAHAREQEERLRLESEGLLEGLQVLIEPADSAAMFSRLLEVMRGVLHFEQACVLIGEAGGTLSPVASTCVNFENTTWTPGKLFQRVISGQPTAAFDIRPIEEWRTQPSIAREGVVSALHVPLRGDQHPAMLVCTHSQRAFFNKEHMRLAKRFSPLAAQALLNAEASELAFRQRLLEEEKQTTEERNQLLKAARDQALEASRMKSDFLANMSHEIRTPMNAIIGMAHLALESDLSGKSRGHVEKILLSANSLLGLINDILDFSKVEAGKLDLEIVDFSLEKTFDNLQSILGQRAAEKALRLKFELDPALPPRLRGDPLRIQQVLLNLANNAIKFTEKGEIRVSASLLRASEQTVQLELAVSDTGIGIQADQFEHIFDSFTQADTSTTRTYGGTGLGLAISKRLAEVMGGEIGVDSQPGHGSRFHIVLPLDIANGDDALVSHVSQQDIESAVEQLRGARLLLAEDNAFNQEVALSLLRERGISVELAENGEQALKMLAEQDYDGVLMDCQMPVLDGYEATRRLRKKFDMQTLPVIAMTANVLRDDVQRALDSGMNDLIGKPIDLHDMFITMARWITPAKQADNAQPTLVSTPAPSLNDELDQLQGIDTAAGIRRLGGNPQLYLKLLKSFVVNQRESIHHLLNALNQRQNEEAVRLLHTLKGTAGSIGAAQLQALAAEGEKRLRNTGELGEAECGDIQHELEHILGQLQRLPEANPAPPETPVRDPQELLQLLLDQIEEFNTDAQETAEQLLAQQLNNDWQPPLEAALEALQSYDFDSAREAISGEWKNQA